MYPALMAITVNAVRESQRAQVIATFTMFFEVGTAVGGVLFGTIAEFAGKRGGFLAGSVAAAIGLYVLWRVLLPAGAERRARAHTTTLQPAVPQARYFTNVS
jgi:MFS family permease